MPSNERVAAFLDLQATLRRRRHGLPAELAELVNNFVEAGGMHTDAMLWDHTNASLACNPDALLNLLDEAIAVGRVLGAPAKAETPAAPYLGKAGAVCSCGHPMRAGSPVCTSDPHPPRCNRCQHMLSHGECPLCSPGKFYDRTGQPGYP